jgi:hypothetical protein
MIIIECNDMIVIAQLVVTADARLLKLEHCQQRLCFSDTKSRAVPISAVPGSSARAVTSTRKTPPR